MMNNINNNLSPIVSVAPITLNSPGRDHELQVRISAPVFGDALPIILFSHGFGSSMDAYAPLVHYWAARGFVVIQPTYLDSKTLSTNPAASHEESVKAFLNDPIKLSMWRSRVADAQRVLDHLNIIESAVPGLSGRARHQPHYRSRAFIRRSNHRTFIRREGQWSK